MDFDALLLLSFGGPEGPEQVRPFLENVTRGRDIPPERLDDGRRALSALRRRLADQRHQPRADRPVEAELADRGTELPVYFGNRNWEPYVEDTVAAMRDNGIRRAAVFTTSAWGGYSGCTQYSEDIARARAAAGARCARTGQAAPVLRPSAARRDVRRRDRRRGRRRCPRELRGDARLVFTAHSIPLRAPIALRPGPLQPPGRHTRRGWSRPRRATPTTTRCGSRGRARHRCRGWNPMWPITFGARRRGHQGRDRLPDRLRRRPHRGGVGPRQRTARAGRATPASRSPGRPRPTPTAASRGWPST